MCVVKFKNLLPSIILDLSLDSCFQLLDVSCFGFKSIFKLRVPKVKLNAREKTLGAAGEKCDDFETHFRKKILEAPHIGSNHVDVALVQ
jgi:hypothetical protein